MLLLAAAAAAADGEIATEGQLLSYVWFYTYGNAAANAAAVPSKNDDDEHDDADRAVVIRDQAADYTAVHGSNSTSTSSNAKQVFAHYMLCFAAFGQKDNSSNATAGYQQEMAVAQANGLDGFAIEYLGHDSYCKSGPANCRLSTCPRHRRPRARAHKASSRPLALSPSTTTLLLSRQRQPRG